MTQIFSSTDQKAQSLDTPNDLTSNVIVRGSFTIVLSSQTVGVSGQTTVVTRLDGTTKYPNVDVYRDASTSTPYYRKAPYSMIDNNGLVTENVYIDVLYDNALGYIDIYVSMFSRTFPSPTTKTFYFVIYSTGIAPSATDATSIAQFNYKYPN